MSAGKGDRPRPVDKTKWDENYDRIFSKRKTIQQWADYFGDVIRSYDGFREYNQDDLLSRNEYEKGIVRCTLIKSNRLQMWKDAVNKIQNQ